MSTRSVSPPRQANEPLSSLPGEEAQGAVLADAAEMTLVAPRHRRFLYVLWSPLRSALPAIIVGLVLLGFWQILVQTGAVPAIFLPAPATVLRSFRFSLTDPNGSLLTYAGTTLLESLLGCALGTLIALPLGYAIARSRRAAGTVQPYMAASQALPALALAPLLALWIGYDLTPIILLCALIVFFPMVITTVLGLRLLDTEILDAARVGGAGRWAMLRYIELPLALPSILAGLRTSLTLSITGAVVGEFVIGGKGLGELLVIDLQSLDAAGEFATLLTLALLAAVLYGGMRLIERRFSYAEASS